MVNFPSLLVQAAERKKKKRRFITWRKEIFFDEAKKGEKKKKSFCTVDVDQCCIFSRSRPICSGCAPWDKKRAGCKQDCRVGGILFHLPGRVCLIRPEPKKNMKGARSLFLFYLCRDSLLDPFSIIRSCSLACTLWNGLGLFIEFSHHVLLLLLTLSFSSRDSVKDPVECACPFRTESFFSALPPLAFFPQRHHPPPSVGY